MVQPATAVALAKMSIDLGKGLFGAIAARKRAAYVGKQLDEQSKMLSIQWNRKITESVGQVVGGLGDRGLKDLKSLSRKRLEGSHLYRFL